MIKWSPIKFWDFVFKIFGNLILNFKFLVRDVARTVLTAIDVFKCLKGLPLVNFRDFGEIFSVFLFYSF